jgi:hypothetical protein
MFVESNESNSPDFRQPFRLRARYAEYLTVIREKRKAPERSGLFL